MFARTLAAVDDSTRGGKASLDYVKAHRFFARFLRNVAEDESVRGGRFFEDATCRQVLLQSNFLDSISSTVNVSINGNEVEDDQLSVAGPVAKQVAEQLAVDETPARSKDDVSVVSAATRASRSTVMTRAKTVVSSVSKSQPSYLRVIRKAPEAAPIKEAEQEEEPLVISRHRSPDGGSRGNLEDDDEDPLLDLPDHGTVVGEHSL